MKKLMMGISGLIFVFNAQAHSTDDVSGLVQGIRSCEVNGSTAANIIIINGTKYHFYTGSGDTQLDRAKTNMYSTLLSAYMSGKSVTMEIETVASVTLCDLETGFVNLVRGVTLGTK